VDRVRLAALAARQCGLVAARQLPYLGIPASTFADWVIAGQLFRRLPGVYAVGHVVRTIEAEFTAALLWAGPGAMLGHQTGGWWLGLISRRPRQIEVSTPRHRRSRPGITVRGRFTEARTWHNGLPVAPVSQVLLDLAAGDADHETLRRALAEAEYQGWLELDLLKPRLRRGVAGSARLRAAIADHEPRLAMTRSEFERRMLALCKRAGLPLPRCNVTVAGLLVDAFWEEQRVVVEVDGRRGHQTWARIKRDRRQEVTLRAAGLTVLRYVWDQLVDEAALVEADLAAALGEQRSR
jgi:very-short-patch-repair endonuclease